MNYVGDTDVSKLPTLPEPAGSFYKFFYISHDERTEQKTNRRLRQDVQLLENYLNKDDAHLDAWQHSWAIFYLAQSHRSLRNFGVAKDLWQRYLSSEISSRRQFSYLRYGSHMGLGQICSESPELWTGAFQRSKTFRIFRAWSILRRLIAYALAWSQSMVYKALALPPSEKKARMKALQRAKGVQHLEADWGCQRNERWVATLK